ncbi:MAG: hypothetical protein HY996_00490 [Micrococcales bacterium]|nr:hypothetical protein [Micrococcales bacterium]
MKTRARLTVFAAVVLLYVGVTPFYGGLRNPNELVRVYMTVAMVEQGTFAVDAVERRWGWVNDKARFGDHVYSSKAPGTSTLGVPVYALHRAIGRALGHAPDLREVTIVLRLGAVTLPSLVFLWFFLGWCERRAAPHLAHAVFASVAAGSLLYAYGITFTSHTLNAACAFGAVMALAPGATTTGARAHARAALAGLLCAGATMFEYPAAIASAAVGVLSLVRLWPRPGRARLVSFALGTAPPAAWTMAFHASAFGSPWSTGYQHLDNPTFRTNIARGFFGASSPSPEAFVRLLADPAFGLFVCTPILLVAFVGLRRALRTERAETVASIVVFLGMALFVSALNNWRGGWTVGPRYLSTVVPFLAGPTLAGLEAIAAVRPGAASVVAGTTTLLALALCGLVSAIFPHVPESFGLPFAQLVVPLLRSGNVPYTVAGLLGAPGLLALAPVALAMLVLVAASTRPVDLGFSTGLATALLAAAIALAPTTSAHHAALAHVKRHWEPRIEATAEAPAGDRELRQTLERWSRQRSR